MKGSKSNLIRMTMLLWIGVLAVFLFWLEMDTRQQEKQLAQTTANAFFQQILISRLWNASHGGVYVPVSASTRPNPYLPLPGRDLTADNGLQLTKINPAYMTRQIAELAQKDKNGIQFHITSLKPIRPENKATVWEEKWLKSFEQGVKEQGEFFTEGKTTWFRYMAPLRVEAECLKCHVQQGYKLGDIRGGLSVSMPYASHSHRSLFAAYGVAALLGLLLIFIGGTFYERKRLLFDAIFDNTIPTCVTDNNYTILLANESYWREFGSLPGPKKSIKCYEHRPGKSCHTEHCPLIRIINGAGWHFCETNKEKDGELQHFIVTAKPLLDPRGKIIGVVESFQEITERKQAEEALEESNRKLEALSITDGLTGIANRRYFDEVLAQEHARHARSGAELSLIMLDIDHFKAFNDCYGHVKGDECLRQVAQVIAACASRPADLAARYGGEEFACILPETDRMGAVTMAEKIRRGIIFQAIPHKGTDVAACVTASLGVVTVRCSAKGSAVEIVTLADKLLYQAKASGRNRVECAGPALAGPEIKDSLVQLTWKDSFCCDNLLLDAQHQSLFHLSNELLDAVLSARPAPETATIISRLLAEVSQHFHDEEEILEAAGFPSLSHHRIEHAKLLAKGLELSQQFEASTLTVGAVFQFLVNEVVMLHMLEADREYFPLLKKTAPADHETEKM